MRHTFVALSLLLFTGIVCRGEESSGITHIIITHTPVESGAGAIPPENVIGCYEMTGSDRIEHGGHGESGLRISSLLNTDATGSGITDLPRMVISFGPRPKEDINLEKGEHLLRESALSYLGTSIHYDAEDAAETAISIYAQSGLLVMQGAFDPDGHYSVEALPPGVYVAMIENGLGPKEPLTLVFNKTK